MALKVAKPQAQPKLTVTRNYGMQGSTYNPQPTAPVKYIQNATPPKPLQAAPLARPLQGGNGNNVQNAATVQQIAEAQRIAVAKEVARQKEVKRAAVQGGVDSRVAANTSALKLRVSSSIDRRKIAVGRNYYPGSIDVPKYVSDDPEYDKIKAEAKANAMKLVDGLKGSDAKGFDKFVDKVTFGSDRRASGARKWAEKQANDVADRQVKVYQGKLDAHNKLQATLQADYEKKKLKLSATELNAMADQYNAKIAASVADLKRVEAYTVGTVEGYGLKAEEKMTSKAASAAGFINRNVIQKAAENPVWKYTLGGGSENIPSVVTAPSRAINWVGNINTKDRQIYKYGGGTENRVTTGKNAWQSTFEQRNVNLKPVTDKPFDKKAAYKALEKGADGTISTYWQQFKRAKNDKEKEDIAKKYWNDQNRQARNQNSAQELAADPLNLLLGAGAASRKAGQGLSKAAEVARVSKYTSKAMKAFDKVADVKNATKTRVAENKIVRWLGAEAKTPEQSLADAIDLAKKNQGVAQHTLLPRLASIDKKISGGKIDFSIFDDFAKLTDSEAKILQRMKAGKLTARDRAMLAGKNYQTTRETLEAIAAKWDDFAENMRVADRVKTSRFGKGKRTYSPSTAWTQGDLKKYNFRLKSKGRIQNADDFAQGAVDRYIKSDLRGTAKVGRERLQTERDELLKRYEETMTANRSDVEKYYKRTKSPLNKIRKVAGLPTSVWKKSVLKYRPAWTVNNVAYNTQAGFLSGGLGYGAEQIKMLNPRYARKAMDAVPASVKTDLAKEIGGKGKLNKFYAGVENNPRVATFRALKKKGLSDEQALKRVNKYFFEYKTKNWERPIKAAVPFWQWQKNLTKAAAQMPFDRPAAAIGYNRLDRHQDQAFEDDFETVVPKLKKLGYSDSEIEAFKAEQAKYFKGKLKIGGKYWNTPFNAFSEKGLTSMGFNPYVAAAGETAEGVDSFGRKVSGNEASIERRLTTKFPQAELGYKFYKGMRVDKGLDKPSVKYIGKEGGEGYGLTKEKQGYDPSKPNYVASMDPRSKNKADALAFLGKPRDMEFDKDKFIKGKTLQKVTAEYFSKSAAWKDMDYEKSQAEQAAFFKKYGMTADDFYKGILAKYDTDHTKKIKGLKEEAANKNKSLFDEYAKQPQGTRNIWATDKLRELTATGYFDDNPFLKSFKWVNRDTAFKADKQKAVKHALATGDWSSYRKLAGTTTSQKRKDYQYAKSSGDWSGYKKKYGTKSTPYQTDGKFFKTAATMKKYQDGQFWRKYIDASKAERKKLLAENPQFNLRANWTDEQWDTWKDEQKSKKYAKLQGYRGDLIDQHLAENKANAGRYTAAQTIRRGKKRVAYA